MIRILLYLSASIFVCQVTLAASHEVTLKVESKSVDFSGNLAQALTVNNQIPAPTLRFREGDKVIIHVENRLHEPTSVHWHGLLVPWTMDGVAGVTQHGIQPGETFTYEFKLKQSGTYWYHAHTGLQQQQGLYGAFIIDPAKPAHNYDKDLVLILSDWSDKDGETVLANLKKNGDYYTPRFPLQPSLTRFLDDYENASPSQKKKLVDDYLMMQQMRMSIFDLSDIAYDAYLLNGTTTQHPWTQEVALGDIVRLRFIGAGGSTRYQVKIPGTKMKVIHVQGNDVVPYEVESFTLSPGETTDVLLSVEKDQPYVIYGESADTRGKVVGILRTKNSDKQANLPEAFPVPAPITMGHQHMPRTDHQHMSMTDHHHRAQTMGTKYQDLKSAVVTNNPDMPVEEIHMKLDGYMGHYIWFINGLTEHEAPPIIIKPGKRYRLIFTNQSMMIHPMHLHGHFFILRNGHGAYDPLLHTIEVAPGATVIADFDANASGQWLFHCHHLFHMVSGMSRVFQNSDLGSHPLTSEQQELVKHPVAHAPHLFHSAFLEGSLDPFHNIQKASFRYMLGRDYHKLQLYTEEAELNKGQIETADIDIFYWHLVDQFWAVKGGLNYVYKPSHTPYIQPGIGLEGIMPWFIDTNLRLYLHKGSVKVDLQLSRDTQLYNNVYLRLGVRPILATKTVPEAEIGTGLNSIEYLVRSYWMFQPGHGLFFEVNNKTEYGQTKKFSQLSGKKTDQTSFLFGLSLLR